jgi:hypothetical protein
MTNQSLAYYSECLNHKAQTVADGIAELKRLRDRVQRAEARISGDRLARDPFGGRKNLCVASVDSQIPL